MTSFVGMTLPMKHKSQQHVETYSGYNCNDAYKLHCREAMLPNVYTVAKLTSSPIVDNCFLNDDHGAKKEFITKLIFKQIN